MATGKTGLAQANMAQRQARGGEDSGGGKRFLQRLMPLLGGVLAAIVLGLTLLAAVALATQEQELVALVTASATPSAKVMATPTATAGVSWFSPSPSPRPTEAPPTLSSTPSPVPSTSTPRATVRAEARCVPPSNWRLYTVRRGDSLSTLAWRYWTSQKSLVQANCLQSYAVYTGQRIYIPNVSPRQSCGKPSGWVSYIIQRGDTLSSIARRVGTTVAALKQGNCLPSDRILAGASLWVPRLPAAPQPTSRPRPTSTRRPTSTPGTGPTATPTEPPPTKSPTEPPPTEPPPTEPPPTEPPPTKPPPTEPPPTEPPPTKPPPTEPPPPEDPPPTEESAIPLAAGAV